MDLLGSLRFSILLLNGAFLGFVLCVFSEKTMGQQSHISRNSNTRPAEALGAPLANEELSERVFSKDISAKDRIKIIERLLENRFQIPEYQKAQWQNLFKKNRIVYTDEKAEAKVLFELFAKQEQFAAKTSNKSSDWTRFLFDLYAKETQARNGQPFPLDTYEKLFLENFENFSDSQLFNLGDPYFNKTFGKANIHETFLDQLEQETNLKNLEIRTKPITALRELNLGRDRPKDERLKEIMETRYVKNANTMFNRAFAPYVIPFLGNGNKDQNPRELEAFLDSDNPHTRLVALEEIVSGTNRRDSSHGQAYNPLVIGSFNRATRSLAEAQGADEYQEKFFLESLRGLASLSRKNLEDTKPFNHLVDGFVFASKTKNGDFRDDSFSESALKSFTFGNFLNSGDYFFKENYKRLPLEKQKKLLSTLVSWLQGKNENARKTAAFAIRHIFETQIPKENLEATLSRVFPDYSLEKLNQDSGRGRNVSLTAFVKAIFGPALLLGGAPSGASGSFSKDESEDDPVLKKLDPEEVKELTDKLLSVFERYPEPIAKPN